jgi:hypothetical protein
MAPANHSGADISSIGAYKDTIHCFHEQYSTVIHCGCKASYDGGFNWMTINVEDPTVTHEAPATTSRRGGGVGVIYRFYTTPRQGRFVWLHYGGGWTPPYTYTDHEPHYNQPSIEYTGDGIFGAVYLKWAAPDWRSAWFDRGTCCVPPIRGNVNNEFPDAVNIVDLTYMIAYLFGGGPPPPCETEADVNGDTVVNIIDVTYLVAYLFGGGPAPLPCP